MQFIHMASKREIVSVLLGIALFNSSIVSAQWQGPVFSQQPPARLVFSNASGSQVSCSAHGSPTPRLTWMLKDGSDVTAVPGLRQSLGNGTLYFPPFRAQDFRSDVHEAVYRCKADNSVGAILSREVRVRAVISQHYDVQVYRSHVLAGNTAVLTCIIPAQVQDYVTVTSWYKDEHILLPGRSDVGGRYVVTSGSGELLIKSARAEDALSRYSCLTLHSLTGERKRSQPATLTVTEPSGSSPPRLVQRAVTEISAELGADVHLSCAAQANPPPTFTWFRSTGGGSVEVVLASPRVVPAQGLLHIRRVEHADAGRWLCEAQNAFGTQRVESTLTVTAPLSAHIQTRVQVVNSGGSAMFNCTVDGAPILSVEWLHDGRVLTPDSRRRLLGGSRSLQVTHVNREDRGMYQCAISNDRDSATAAAELKLGDTVPELQHTFIEQALRPGPMVSLRCSATGSPPPQFSWLLDGRPLGDVMSGPRYAIGQFVDLSGDVVSHLNISAVRSEDGGHYSCRASNTLGNAEHSARVNIYGPPYVRSVGPLRAVARANLTLHCPYSGYPITSVKWERHGQDMLLDLRHRQDSTQGGALLIANVDPTADAGAYTCTVHNRAGEQAKREILLEVVNPPLIEPFSFPQSVQQGGRTQVTCSVSSGDMPVYFSWTKDGAAIPNSLKLEERAADFFSLLIFKEITSQHSGVYTCTASNSAAKVNYTAELMVKVPPRWLLEPTDAAAHLGHTIDIHCSASGFPEPVVTWLRQKVGVPSEYEPVPILDGRLSILENGSLRITNSAPQDEGQFLCRAINGIGSGLSKMVHVMVNEPARFEVSSRNISARRGDPVNLLCDVFGDQPIQVTWTRNGNRVELSSYRSSISEVQTSTGVSSQLSLNQADRQDSGTYQCQAENSFGRANYFIHLAVQERPDPPVALEVVEVDGKSIKLSWRRPFDGNSPVLGFMIQYQPLGTSGIGGLDWTKDTVQNISLPSISTKMSGTGPREQAVVPHLHPSTTYALRMLAVNDIASSPFTEPVMAKTQEEV